MGNAKTPDPGDRRDRVESQISVARTELADLSAESAAAVRRLARSTAALGTARSRLAAATSRLEDATARTAQLKAQLRVAKAKEAAGVAALARNAAQTDAAEQRRNEMARVAYESGGSGELVALVDMASARDLAEQVYTVQEAGAHQEGVIDELEEARRVRLVEQAALVKARRDIAQLTVQARAAQTQAAQARAEQAATTRELSGLVANQAASKRAIDGRRVVEERRLTQLEAESVRLTRVLQARAAASRAKPSQPKRYSGAATASNTSTRSKSARNSAPIRRSGARLSAPVGAPITSGFGMRFHPVLNYSRLHAGIDYGAACGTPVHAADSGDVVRAGWAGGYGKQVVVAHRGPLATSYSHLSRIVVSSGHVNRGQLIGYSGTTGLSTGCHLHFETRVNGSPVDPRGYL